MSGIKIILRDNLKAGVYELVPADKQSCKHGRGIDTSVVVPPLPHASIGKTLTPKKIFNPTIKQVFKIRDQYATKKYSLRQLAAKYDASRETIIKIIKKTGRFAKV